MRRSASVGGRAALASASDFVDQLPGLLVDRVELVGLEQPRLGHPLAEQLQAILVGLQMLDLAGPPIGHRVALEVAVVAHELDVDDARPLAVAGALDRLARGIPDLEEVVAVDAARRDAVGPAALDQIAGASPGAGCGFGVAIVLEDEDRRQVPDLGEVHALGGRALIGAAVADERDRDAAGLERLGGQRGAADQRRPAADDAVRAHHALGQIGDVHRAALAAAKAVLAAEDLGHHRLDVAALGDAVAVAAVGRGDVILVVQMQADADPGRLLAGIEMDETRDVARRELLVDGVLELADGAHLPVGFEQLVAA